MMYLIGVFFPVLVQSLFVFIIIEMNTGNGSWVGLGALLIGMFAIPATAITNLIYIKSNKDKSSVSVLLWCFLISLIMPFIMIILLMIG